MIEHASVYNANLFIRKQCFENIVLRNYIVAQTPDT